MSASKKKAAPVEPVEVDVVEPVEDAAEPVAEFVPPKLWEPKRPADLVMSGRETYASIGEQWAPKGVSGVEFAREVYRANLGAALYPGKVVRLPR